MKLYRTITLALLACFFLTEVATADEPIRRSPRQERRSRGLFLDIGQFSPYARGIYIDIGPKTHPLAKRRVNVKVGPGPYIPVDINVNSGGGPIEQVGGSLTPIPGQPEALPDEGLLGAPSEGGNLGEPSGDATDPFAEGSDLLGKPSDKGPALMKPEAPPKLDSPPEPVEKSKPDSGIKLEPPPLPGNPIAPPLPDSIPSLLQPKDIPAENPNVIRSTTAPAYLGVSAQPVSAALSSQLSQSLPKGTGLMITQITPGSAASDADLQKHDILVKYNGKKVGSLQELVKLVSENRPGDEVKLLIIRKLKEQEVKVTLGVRPATLSSVLPPQKYDFFYP